MMTMNNGLETRRWEDFNLKTLTEHSNPAQAEFSHKSMHIAGLPGLLDFGSEIEGKSFEINLNQLVRQELDLAQTINALNQFFFDEYKQPRFIKIIFDYDPNKYIWAKVAESFTPNRATLLKKLTVPFIQFDANKYSVVVADEIVWGSQQIDFQADYKLGHTGSGARDTQITSNTTIRPFLEGLALMPFIVLNGSGTNVKITCANRELNIGTFVGKEIEIDTENYVTYTNGVESNIDLNEFYFVPNEPVSITGTNMNFKLTVHYRDIYM